MKSLAKQTISNGLGTTTSFWTSSWARRLDLTMVLSSEIIFRSGSFKIPGSVFRFSFMVKRCMVRSERAQLPFRKPLPWEVPGIRIC